MFLQFKSSFLCLISIWYALYKKRYNLVIAPIGVFITSINHWRKPEKKSIRRKIDLAVVYLALFYQVYKTRKNRNFLLYLITIAMGGLMHKLSKYMNTGSYVEDDISAWLHTLLHLYGNVGNLIIYS